MLERNTPALFLDEQEKKQLKKRLGDLEEIIIVSWLKNEKMCKFYKKNNIQEEEVQEYIRYFGQIKILHPLTEITDENTPQENTYISTKFFSFIQRKNIGIDDLLTIIIVLREEVISFFIGEDFRFIQYIMSEFDSIITYVSKRYNDTISKLLNEHNKAIDNSNIISKTDIYGTITSVNEEFCKLSGYAKEELIGKTHNIVRHPDMPKEIFKDLWDTIQNKKIWKGIIKNKKKDSTSYWVKSTIVPILDKNNQIIEYISIRTDITELKEAYKNFEEYTDALNNTNMVLKLDKSGKIISINDIFINMSGYKREELIGKNYIEGLLQKEEILPKEQKIPILKKDEIKKIQNDILGHKTWKGNIKNKGKLGNFFWTTTSIIPIINLHGDILEYVIIQNDITDLEISQQKLKASLEKQKELDMRKNDFLNIASHELRTPMTSIKGYLSMILDGDAGDINTQVRSYLIQAYKGSQRLLDLINDMLDISKIESGKHELSLKRVEIASLIKETAREIQGLMEGKQQNFIISIGFEKFEYTTDENKLKQVLLNLLGNANKFTPDKGDIHFDCQKGEKELIISVTDNGIGIEKSDFGKIFEKFGQVKNSLTRNINGTGLGLPIVKALIEQMDGSLDIESTIGKGTKFSIRLPI